MKQEDKKQNSDPDDTKTENLQWEKKTKNPGIFELLQPILGNFVLLIEEERKRTLEKLEKTKDTLERMKNNR